MNSFDVINNFQYTDINSLKTFIIDFLNVRIDWLNGQAVYFELMKDYKKQNRSFNFINSLEFLKEYLTNINFEIGNNISDRSIIYIPERYINLLKKDKIHGLFYLWYIISSVMIDYFKVISDSQSLIKQRILSETEMNDIFKLTALHMTSKIYPLTENYYPIIYGARVFLNKKETINEDLDNCLEDILNLFNELETFSMQDLKNHIHDEKYVTSYLQNEQYNFTRDIEYCKKLNGLYKNFFTVHTTMCIGINRHHHLFRSEGMHQYIIYNKNIYFFGTEEFFQRKNDFYQELKKNTVYKV